MYIHTLTIYFILPKIVSATAAKVVSLAYYVPDNQRTNHHTHLVVLPNASWQVLAFESILFSNALLSPFAAWFYLGSPDWSLVAGAIITLSCGLGALESGVPFCFELSAGAPEGRP